jgi:dTDP-4-amino-4,6-dideoxygalactose transaminase
MNIPFVDLHAQYLTIREEIDNAISSVISESGFIRSKFVDLFESEFAHILGVDHCISCANGTDALYILMKGFNIQRGDEVITTAHSWISTSETITQAGGRVVFCDTDIPTYTIDPNLLESLITDKTVGIIPVHLYGQAADMDPILEIAQRHDLWVIEDCAQAHMAEYKGRKVGTMGNAASFSFYPGKNLGAMGDAGCIVTNDFDLSEFCKLYARHGGKGAHTIEGINSRLDGMQAAILSVKLPYLNQWTVARRIIAEKYSQGLSEIGEISIPQVRDGCKHVYHLYVIQCKLRDKLQHYLAEHGISTMLNYPKALPFYPAYSYLGHTPSDFPNAFKHQNNILSLPLYPELTDSQIAFVIQKIKDFYKNDE